ncbi:MAG TPA: flagellar hook capping FlgD N-terminal domain-containing protein [Solirubrobacteraceae bacterium]|nr:flagellar hook capping FlgD N-terminal domain-containing protein [Solirubrobacteraceae bacterium]
MTTVSPTPTSASPTPAPVQPSVPSNTPPSNPAGTLGKNDFLKLMVAQLQSQDPLQPTDSSAYLGQLAQFTELEQVTNMAQTSAQSATAQQVSQAVALIGHTVSCTNPATGETHKGVVQNVQITSSGATLTVEGIAGISPSTITQVS